MIRLAFPGPWRTAAVRAVLLAAMLALPIPALAEGHDQNPDERPLPHSRAQIQFSYVTLVKKTAPAVVNIYTGKATSDRSIPILSEDPLFRRFFGKEEVVPYALGSGVLVTQDGTIVTNYHVIEGADEILVALADRREFKARIVVTDRKTDLAVLKVDPKGKALPFLPLRDSDSLEVGELVMAIGNPFGFRQTVTTGIISALARSQVDTTDLEFFIQTDAAINSGNSGGALVTMDGRLAGINTAGWRTNETGGSLGINFAIPANMVRAVLSSINEEGRLVRPWLGIKGQAVTSRAAQALGLDRPLGVIIEEIYPKSPAAKAGLRPGDVVLALNAQPVNAPEALEFLVATLPIGYPAKLTVLRKGIKSTMVAKMAPPPEVPRRNARILKQETPLQGATVANLSPALASELELNIMERGIVLLDIKKNSTAEHLGFQPRDIVAEVNGKPVNTVKQLVQALRGKHRRWEIGIKRDGNPTKIRVRAAQ